jgi:hypothetical protein
MSPESYCYDNLNDLEPPPLRPQQQRHRRCSGGGGLIGFAGPRGLGNPVVNIALPRVFTPTPTTAVVPQGQLRRRRYRRQPPQPRWLRRRQRPLLRLGRRPASGASVPSVNSQCNEQDRSGINHLTETSDLKASATKKGAVKTRQLKVYLVGITEKKTVFLKDGKLIKSNLCSKSSRLPSLICPSSTASK